MDRTFINCDDTETEENKFYQHKILLLINDINIIKIAVSNNKVEIYSYDENSKQIYPDDFDDYDEKNCKEIYSDDYNNSHDSHDFYEQNII